MYNYAYVITVSVNRDASAASHTVEYSAYVSGSRMVMYIVYCGTVQ